MTEPLTLTKLIVLYMLNQVDFELKKTQLFDFILEKEYTNYYTLQQAIYELSDANLIQTTATHSTTYVSITSPGKESLRFFQNRISDGIKKDIELYFKENKLEIHNEVSVMSNYYRTGQGEYVADLSAREKTSDLLNLKVYMPTEDAAAHICENWKNKSQEIYAYILENLL